jgi:hypothetical protein
VTDLNNNNRKAEMMRKKVKVGSQNGDCYVVVVVTYSIERGLT